MRRVLIVAYEGATTLDITGPAEVFAEASRRAPRPAYQVELASLDGGQRSTSSTLRIATRDLARVRPGPRDTVVVAGGGEDALRTTVADPRLKRWLRQADRVVERMTSVCSGSFLLADAGLLDGRRATTHWVACEQLAQLYPAVRGDPHPIFIVDGRYWTSAGVSTGIDMSLAIVETDLGRAVADAVAASLVLYLRCPGFQSQFSHALVAQLDSSDPLAKLSAWIRAHLREANVPTVARVAALSERTLHRRCRDALGVTPGKLIDKLRVEHARLLLATTESLAKDLADQCGFGSVANMKRSFVRELGVGPAEYRVLHRRPAAARAAACKRPTKPSYPKG